MIVLREIIHSIGKEKKDGLINLDSWRWPDVDHLATMGFQFIDDYRMRMDKPPHITVYKKADEDNGGKKVSWFYVEEEDKPTRRFKEFNEVIDYFDSYEQPSLGEE